MALFDAGNANATIPLASAYPYCGPSGDSVSNQILINFASTQILTGPLYLLVKKGTDNTTIANSCGRFLNSGDTLAIYYVKGNISVSLGNDIDVCSNINELPVKLDAGYDSSNILTYQWYLNGSPISGANNSTYEADTTGNYSLVASISAGCAGSDDVQINVINMPVIDLGNDKNICEGDEVLLDMGPDGMIYQWYFNGIAINMEIYSELFASTPGQYVGALINYGSSGHLCFSVDTVIVTSTSAPLLTLSDETICANLFPFVIDAGNTGASFQWSTSATDTLQQISVFESGIYGVTITNNFGCSIMEWMELTTEDPLDAPILDCGTVSANGYDFIYSWADVPGNSGYEVSFDNINWLQANTPTSSTSHGTNTFSTAFLVRAIMNGACSYGAMAPYVSCEIQVPDIVTPNGDGINDLFLIPNINSYPDNTFSVYSRWGVKVYSETGYNNTSKVFSGKDLPSGRYFYTLVYGNEKILKSGTLTISK